MGKDERAKGTIMVMAFSLGSGWEKKKFFCSFIKAESFIVFQWELQRLTVFSAYERTDTLFVVVVVVV